MTINTSQSLDNIQLYAPCSTLLPKQKLECLPQELFRKIIDFILPQNGYLNHRNPDKLGLYYTSKALNINTIEYKLLNTRSKSVNEIIRKIKGDIKNLGQSGKDALKIIGPSITSLDLQNIQLTSKMVGTIALYFPNLQQLYLENCGLNDTNCEHIARFTKLKKISLKENLGMTSTALQSIAAQLPELISFNLSVTAIDDLGLHELVKQLSNLEKLFLADCGQLTDNCLTAIICLKELQTLDLSNCSWLNDDTFKTVLNLKKIEALFLSGCLDISDATVALFPQQLPQLKILHLERCLQLTPVALNSIATLQQLTHLNLYHCNQIAMNTEMVHKLLNLHDLKILSLPRQMNFVHLQGITGLKKLTSLNLSGLTITEDQLRELGNISGLKNLYLADCIVPANWAQYLVRFRELEVLDLNGCTEITDLHALIHLPKLRELILADTSRIFPEFLITISKMSKLSILDLSHCQNLINRGYTHLHYLQELPNLTQLILNGWNANPSDHSGYSFFGTLNDAISNVDNALNDPPLLRVIAELQKQFPSLEVTPATLCQLKDTIQKIVDVIPASGTSLLTILLSVLSFPGTILDILNAHIRSTTDVVIQDFLNACKILCAIAVGFIIASSLSIFPAVGTITTLLLAFWACFEYDFDEESLIKVGIALFSMIAGIHTLSAVSISLIFTISTTVMAILGSIALSSSATYAVSHGIHNVTTKISELTLNVFNKIPQLY